MTLTDTASTTPAARVAPAANPTTPAITYRPMQLGDAHDMARMLGDTWHTDVQGEERTLHGLVDVARYAKQHSFAQVAEACGRVVGFVFARAGKPSATAAAQWGPVEQDAWARARALNAENAQDLAEFFVAIEAIDAALLKESGRSDFYELVCFCVSPETRGQGVGSTLLAAARDYLREQGATQAIFYTDTSCNWQYYEHRGMKRLAQRVVETGQGPASMMSEEMYLYQMDL